MSLQKATRAKTKLRIGLSAPSGAGKTYGALQIAKGLCGQWEKIAVIDSEKSAHLYSQLGEYFVNEISSFSPEDYIKAIRECEEAGIEVIIIDSMTHEWEELLILNDKIAQTKFKGNSWAAWSDTTPRHQALINKIVTSPAHIITTVRNKVDTVQEGGKVKKVGIKEIQREGYEYELTVNLNIDRETHLATASKDRTELFEKNDPFLLSEKTGKLLKKWSEAGRDLIVEIEELAVTVNADLSKTVAYFGKEKVSELTTAQQLKILEKLQKMAKKA